MVRFLFLSLLFSLCAVSLSAQPSIKGVVTDAETGETLIGATVLIKDSNNGVLTDFDGKFEIKTDKAFPVTLVVSYTGFEKQELAVESARELVRIVMATSAILTQVTITGQSISDEQKKEPLTIESLDLRAIKATPSENFYEGLGHLKGVDMTSASMGFKVVNTRGFNSTVPIRSLQIIDGLDNSSPSLNFALGNFLGASELDLLGVDLIVGASSAFYGPNAFNGVISMKTKDPFLHKGLSVQLKRGERQLTEAAIRYADAIKNKAGEDVFGYKINFSFMQANDWKAENYSLVDESEVPSTRNPGGYDAVNRYGDEYDRQNDFSTASPWVTPGLGIYYRSGYREEDIVDYNTDNTKGSVAFHYKTKPGQGHDSPEIVLAGNYGTGTTVAQNANRVSLKDIQFLQGKIEYRKKDKFFVRAYTNYDDFGNTYDPVSTAYKLQNLAKEDERWSGDYFTYWANNIKNKVLAQGYPGFSFPNYDYAGAEAWLANPVNQDSLTAWHQQTAAYANSNKSTNASDVPLLDYFVPGTARFQEKFDSITTALNNSKEGGTRYYSKSLFYHVHGEYVFKPTWTDKITVGSNMRWYRPDTKGTILLDSTDTKIKTQEWGGYAGLEKSFYDNKLIGSAALRLDKHQNFGLLATPAASLVYNPRKNNFLRASFSAGIRNPILIEQYLYLETGRAILSGNLNGYKNLITTESFDLYREKLELSKLEYFDVPGIKPEKVKTLELGYRTTVLKNVYVDASYYYNFYKDFLGYRIGIEAAFDSLSSLPSDLQVYRVSGNSQNLVTTQGFALALNYYFANYFSFGGNYSWNKLNKVFADDPIIPAYNTPEHKYNISFSGRDVPLNLGFTRVKKFGFAVNYKYVDGFLFEASPQFTGYVNSYKLLDAQINVTLDRIHTTIKLGASNILNNKTYQAYGSPAIGRLAYATLTYDFHKK